MHPITCRRFHRNQPARSEEPTVAISLCFPSYVILASDSNARRFQRTRDHAATRQSKTSHMLEPVTYPNKRQRSAAIVARSGAGISAGLPIFQRILLRKCVSSVIGARSSNIFVTRPFGPDGRFFFGEEWSFAPRFGNLTAIEKRE